MTPPVTSNRVRIFGGVPITEANRFSRFVKDREELTQWLMDFQMASIPAVIVLTDQGFALYRTGMLDITDDIE